MLNFKIEAIKNKFILLAMSLLFVSFAQIFSMDEEVKEDEKKSQVKASRLDFDDDDDCNAKLKIANFVAKKIKAKCIEADRAKITNLCTSSIDSDTLCANHLN